MRANVRVMGEAGSSKDSASEFDMRMVAAMEASVAVMSRSVEQRDLKGRANGQHQEHAARVWRMHDPRGALHVWTKNL